MSTLWTPSGEHPVPRAPSGEGNRSPGSRDREPQGGEGAGAKAVKGRSTGDEAGPSPEELEEAKADMEAMREQLLRAPVELVISNHVMGLWELAALHLSNKPPQLPQAQLAIDAMNALVEGLRGRLGEAENTLVEGLGEIRMAFVQVANAERRQPQS